MESPTVLIIGKNKTDTQSALVSFALEKIYNGERILFIGNETTNEILSRVLNTKSILYLNPSLYPFGLNVLHSIPPNTQPFFASRLTNALIKDNMTPYREYTFRTYFRFCVQTLLQVKGTNLSDVRPLLLDPGYRAYILGQIKDTNIHDFFEHYESLKDSDRNTNIESTLSLIYDIILTPLVLECVSNRKNKIDFNKTVLVSLSEKDIGTDNMSLIGSLILSVAKDTTIFVDEAHRYGRAILDVLQSPCYLGAQYLDSFQKSVLPAILSVDQVIAFRTTPKDAKVLDFDIPIANHQLTELPPHRAYTNGEYVDIPPTDRPLTLQEDKIINRSRTEVM